MLTKFREFCDSHSYHFLPLSKEEESSIKLLDALKSQKAPLRAYPALKKLIKRYNMQAMLPRIKRLTLPHLKAVVHIPYRDIQNCIVSLLTDPRIRNRDYLFFDQDPTAPPPEKVKFIEDINTGEAFLESYKKYITKPNQVPLGIIFYIDGAVTGQFSDLPITALKIPC